MENQPSLQEKWYKTRAGVTMLVFLGIFICLLIGFGSLVGYYMVQLQLGNQHKLIEKFTNNPRFTQSQSIPTPASDTLEENIYNYISVNNPQTGTTESAATLMMFIDFECPFCQEAFPVLQKVKDRFEGSVNIVFKHYPLQSIHPQALQAASAATCAQEQDAFWDYYSILFEQKNLSEAQLFIYAADLGLDTKAFTDCFIANKYQHIIEQDIQDGITLGVRGTPTYILNDQRIEGVYNESQWNSLIIDVLSKL